MATSKKRAKKGMMSKSQKKAYYKIKMNHYKTMSSYTTLPAAMRAKYKSLYRSYSAKYKSL